MPFLRSLPPYGPARDAVLLGAIHTGNIDTPTWVKLTLGRVELEVSSDYLTIAGEHVPMAAYVAQAAVESLDAILPTAAIVDAIERDAVVLVPLPTWAPPVGQDRSHQLDSDVLALCEERTQAAFIRGRIRSGQLVAGHRKDVVLARYMPPGVVVIYGAKWPDGRRLQPLHPAGPGGTVPPHEAAYSDYSHGTRAVRNACLLDGKPTTVRAILEDSTLAPLLGGPVAMTRYPATSSSTATSTPGTIALPPLSIARGAHGEAVKEVQRLLSKAGFTVVVDGAFGPITEAAVRSYQGEWGLVQTGIVNEKTLASLRGVAPPDSTPITEPKHEDDTLPEIKFVQAKNYYPGRLRPLRGIVIHDMESAETKSTAENVAAWFAGSNAPMASTHYNVDCDSIVQSVRDTDTAFGAKGFNADGLHVELAGRAAQGAAGWADAYSTAMLKLAAVLVADLCRKWSLPVVFLDADALLRGEKGITTHMEITRAYKESTHTDPGPTFPMDAFLAMVRAAM